MDSDDVRSGVRAGTGEEGRSGGPDLGSAAQRARRARILDATIALASEGGFEAVQMRAVAERADVALGTLYRYFPSKIHLLVSALGREFEVAVVEAESGPLPGDSAADRVVAVLDGTTGALERDPALAEAMVRAFMFADASVRAETRVVERHVLRLLLRAMAPADVPAGDHQPTEEDAAIAKVVGDVWFSGLVQWVTGRAEADEVSRSLGVAIGLLLR